MTRLLKYFLIGFSTLVLLVGTPALTAVLADDGTTTIDSNPELFQSESDGTTTIDSDPVSFSSSSSCQEQRREYPQCGGTTGLENFSSTDTIMVTEITDCNGNKRYENNNLGNLGQCQISSPPVTSLVSSVQQPPVRSVPAANVNANVNNNVNNNIVQNTVSTTVNQSQNQSNTQVVTVQQPPVQGGLSVRFATVDCPAGTNKKVKDNEIICEVTVQPRVEVAAAKVEVKELPKTGLPLLAWAAGAFIPAGLGLKRFGRGMAFDMEDNANYLWEERQYKSLGYSQNNT